MLQENSHWGILDFGFLDLVCSVGKYNAVTPKSEEIYNLKHYGLEYFG